MLTPLQKRKLTRYFNILDLGAKGYIEEEDIFTINLRLAKKKGIDEDSEYWSGVQENIDLIWTYPHKYGISGDPDKVFLIDWLVHEDIVLADERYLEHYVRKITRDVFTLFKQEDERLYHDDYCELITCFGVEKGVDSWSFRRLDRDSKGFLTEDEFVQCVDEYHLSDDRHAPGNYLFGPF